MPKEHELLMRGGKVEKDLDRKYRHYGGFERWVVFGLHSNTVVLIFVMLMQLATLLGVAWIVDHTP